MHGALVLTDFTEFHFVCHDLIVAGRCSFPSASPAQDALFSSLPSLFSLSLSISRLLASFLQANSLLPFASIVRLLLDFAHCQKKILDSAGS